MGTNYYVIKRKPSLHPSAIHIGKSSAGWKFLFRGYLDSEEGFNDEKLNIVSVEDWEKYLDNNELIILDEYDCPISYEEFFAMVERKQTEENEDNFKYNGNVNGYRFSFEVFS